jgi:hypothetical protein
MNGFLSADFERFRFTSTLINALVIFNSSLFHFIRVVFHLLIAVIMWPTMIQGGAHIVHAEILSIHVF